MISINKVRENTDLLIITNIGIVIKIPLEQVSKMSRVTQGVRLINLKDDQKVSTVSLVDKDTENDEDSEEIEEKTE